MPGRDDSASGALRALSILGRSESADPDAPMEANSVAPHGPSKGRVMAMATGDAVRDLGLYLAHVGINAENAEEAEAIAATLEAIFGLPVSHTPVSVLSGTFVETMAGGGRGAHGHLGFHVDSIPEAEAWLAERGIEVDEASRRLRPDGTTHLVYLKPEVAGFAIHLTEDK